MIPSSRAPWAPAGALAALVLLLPQASAQTPTPTFSIDWRSRSKGMPASGIGSPLNEGKILSATGLQPMLGTLPAPAIIADGSQLGLPLANGCTTQQPGVPCQIEVDALSYGTDFPYVPNPLVKTYLYFSVDPYAVGRTIPPAAGHPPSVVSEKLFSDGPADVFYAIGAGQGLPPLGLTTGGLPVVAPNHVGVLDGDGKRNLPTGTPFRYPGLGLIEPTPGTLPPPGFALLGDNLDALSLEQVPGPGMKVFFSLDGNTPDPLLPSVPNTNSAQANGFLPGAILVKQLGAGGSPLVYATPSQLGLDLMGMGTDDLDALIVFDNGDGVFQPPIGPYQWAGGGADMVLFSVRRGSAIIGQPDSLFGLPIEPGDILWNPPTSGAAPGVPPRIWIAAEDLGLGTARSGQQLFGDELDALASRMAPMYDCNGNGVEDAFDIASGTSVDLNSNGIPDECEPQGALGCLCPAAAPPVCGNADPSAGCANSTGVGGQLQGFGSASVALDDLVLRARYLPTSINGLWLMSGTTVPPVFLGDGLRCVGGTIYRFGSFNSGSGGMAIKGPEIVAAACGSLPAGACIGAGSSWTFQSWYRNQTGPCANGTNLTNTLTVGFLP